MICIIDYGMGNLRSVEKAFQNRGFEAKITRSAGEISAASACVLPGVGSFGRAAENLEKFGLTAAVKDFITSGRRPFMGICLGLQLLFPASAESPGAEGLGFISGSVNKFDTADLKIPHMGWNSVKLLKKNDIFEGIPDNSYFYFVHSYYGSPADTALSAGETEYSLKFPSVIIKDNIYLFQFHPEKSRGKGLRIIENFGKMAKAGIWK